MLINPKTSTEVSFNFFTKNTSTLVDQQTQREAQEIFGFNTTQGGA